MGYKNRLANQEDSGGTWAEEGRRYNGGQGKVGRLIQFFNRGFSQIRTDTVYPRRSAKIRGRFYFFGTPPPDHAFLVANAVAILNNGQICQIGIPDEVITEENLRMAYGVDVRVVREGNAVERKVCFPVLNKV